MEINEKDLQPPKTDQKEPEKTQDNEVLSLKLELEKVKAERDLFKKERDEANANILRSQPKDEAKTEFDNIFGGIA